MAIHTSTFTADNVGDPEPITVPADCKKVTIREAGAAALTDYNLRAPDKTSAVFRKIAGEATVFEVRIGGPFRPALFAAGTILGYIETLSGTVTFSMLCEN